MSDNRIKAVAYARVSTDQQQTCDAQLEAVREYCDRRGWTLAEQYVDVISGAKDKRPGLDRLMGMALMRKFDVVVVYKFDRFARSVSHLIRALETFQSLGIHFVSLSEQVDTSTPAGKLVFTVLGAVAELERELIGERIRFGIKAAKKRLESGPYRKPDGTIVRRIGRPRQQVDVDRALALKQEHPEWGWRRIAEALGVNRETLRTKIAERAIPATNPHQEHLA